MLQDKVRSHAKIDVRTGVAVTEFLGAPTLEGIVVKDVATGESETIHPAGAFVFVGLDPNTAFLKGVVDLDPAGFVVTDQTWMTSVPGIFAAGDLRAGSTKQLAAAVGEGTTALLNVRAFLQNHHHLAVVDPDS